MTREEIKEMLPIMQAFADGKPIQFRKGYEWIDIKTGADLSFLRQPSDYRIKPESKYRAFLSQEECLEEMHKHTDFGWVVDKKSKKLYNINIIGEYYIYVNNSSIILGMAVNDYEFTDGKPFGIKIE